MSDMLTVTVPTKIKVFRSDLAVYEDWLMHPFSGTSMRLKGPSDDPDYFRAVRQAWTDTQAKENT